jgi:hypothetical protein
LLLFANEHALSISVFIEENESAATLQRPELFILLEKIMKIEAGGKRKALSKLSLRVATLDVALSSLS